MQNESRFLCKKGFFEIEFGEFEPCRLHIPFEKFIALHFIIVSKL